MSLTEGRRVYAVGDVHGCRMELAKLIDRVRADLDAAPQAAPVLVFVGDYVDRGPDVRGTIDDLIALAGGGIETVFLRGNHDQFLLDYLQDPAARRGHRLHWLDGNLGGGSTLASYGIARAVPARAADYHATFADTIPPAHAAFFEATTLSWRLGGYVFAHAGLRPGVALEAQDPMDLMWIRDPFLLHPHAFPEGIVVHGHTPCAGIEHHGTRINIDGGAVFGGRLCCLVLEDDAAWDLTAAGRVPVAPGYGLG